MWVKVVNAAASLLSVFLLIFFTGLDSHIKKRYFAWCSFKNGHTMKIPAVGSYNTKHIAEEDTAVCQLHG